MKEFFKNKVFKTLFRAVLVLVSVYFIFVGIRVFHLFKEDNTTLEVDKVLSARISLVDVMGENLPLNPKEKVDTTIAGVDSNTNGIRDDVELAIFKKYPNSPKERAVLLQYALAFQMSASQSVLNEEIATAIVQQEDRAYLCVGSILHRDDEDPVVMEEYFKKTDEMRDFVNNLQFNTKERKDAQKEFYKKVRSYNSLPRTCDLDYLSLTN
ncbi:MAG: hypothetical protein K9L98_00680 [Candidatus Pacebacteria bacterium]|nr:hypothetical protein [Candidatus Paceibacterota bacterium]MCF7862514.1 hypothetical protein [Candidatus Paceibacterota bacterium]